MAIGLWIAGAFDWIRLLCVIPVQFLGAITAAGVVSALLPGKLQAENALSSGTLPVQGLFLEVILTAELVMTIIMLAVEKSRTSFIAPLAIGLALFVAHLIGKFICPDKSHTLCGKLRSLLQESITRGLR